MLEGKTNKPDALPPEGDGSGDDNSIASLKDILGEELKRDFKSDEDALKAVKDTFSYVGKVGKYLPHIEKLEQKLGGEEALKQFMENQIVDKPIDDKFVSREQYNTDMFYKDNPQYAAPEVREILDSMAKTTGKPLSEVVKLDSFSSVYKKISAHDEQEKSKSVLESNPRIGVAVDQITKARDAQAKGDQKGAENAALAAVLEIGK